MHECDRPHHVGMQAVHIVVHPVDPFAARKALDIGIFRGNYMGEELLPKS